MKQMTFYGHPYTKMKFQNIKKGSLHPPYLQRMQSQEADPVIMTPIQRAISILVWNSFPKLRVGIKNHHKKQHGKFHFSLSPLHDRVHFSHLNHQQLRESPWVFTNAWKMV